MAERSAGHARPWLEIDIGVVEAGLRVTVRGSRGERPEPGTLGPEVTSERLRAFADNLRSMARKQSPLEEQLEQAQAFHGALFQGAVQQVLLPLREAAKDGPVLLQLGLTEPLLQAFPWEALCEPRTKRGFLGNSTDMLVVRGVASTQPWLPREVQGAVRVRALVPQETHTPALRALQGTLHDSIASGEVEWLAPIVGPRLQPRYLPELLRREPMPHILHFLGHGGVKADGTPVLQLVDAEGEERWLEVESLVEQIKASGLHKHLRLIVLDACEGAQPGAFASAAELLARTGVAAVVAHLWPVRNDVARLCSSTFYRSLTGANSPQKGDVALSLHEARRTVLMEHGTAEAFSPVLYLRGHDSVLFDFKHRKELKVPAPAPRMDNPLTLALERLLEGPFSLLLGDHWGQQGPALDSFHQRLREELAHAGVAPPPEHLSTSALAQQYLLRLGEKELDFVFQETLGGEETPPPLLELLARGSKPGVHVTLLRLPLLERALAEHRPELTLYVIQPPEPGGKRATVMRREAGGKRWERLARPPALLDLERELVVLRLYRGYLPPNLHDRPLLTEDDLLLGVHALEQMLPPDLADALQSALLRHPALLVGLSMFSWDHRMLLYRLFGSQALPPGSLAVVEPGGQQECGLWEEGRGLPGKAPLRNVFEASGEVLTALLEAQGSGGRTS
ncbi:CHAT domain-containing protein [Archangium gephyra]|uniref:CHAT domain-containing protein n=1 Tax=Archangium gephyra TaxID=48 RepID=A0ABX9JMA9_9BACT|nr:CHAT domain-containing protein [Archangium gephyra]REG22475.1 CHAT domain-containing protein [Archangium gephyra]